MTERFLHRAGQGLLHDDLMAIKIEILDASQAANRDVANTASLRQSGHGRNFHRGGHAAGPTPPGHASSRAR